MNLRRRQILKGSGAALLALPLMAGAQAWPTRPIRLVVPFPPGGLVDTMARLIGPRLAQELGQPVVIDNRAGANANLGPGMVSKAKPDGYTLLVSYSGYHVGNPHLFKQSGWDPVKDFAPVAMMTRAPQVIAVSPKLPVNNLRELIAYAKANPGKLNYASNGNGTSLHLSAELFKTTTGTFITHIPYRGSGPAVQDLMAGQVDIFITTPAGVVSQIQGGKLKGIAVTSAQRLASLPAVATAAEQGLKGYELDSWFALFAPAGTPADVVQVLNTEINRILASSEIRRKAGESGTDVEQMTPQQLGDFTKKELVYWGKVIQGAKITLE